MKRFFALILIAALLIGCAPQPVNYDQAGQIYLDQWLAGLRQMVVESCNAQPDPAACRSAWRAAVDATIDPANQPPVLRQGTPEPEFHTWQD